MGDMAPVPGFKDHELTQSSIKCLSNFGNRTQGLKCSRRFKERPTTHCLRGWELLVFFACACRTWSTYHHLYTLVSLRCDKQSQISFSKLMCHQNIELFCVSFFKCAKTILCNFSAYQLLRNYFYMPILLQFSIFCASILFVTGQPEQRRSDIKISGLLY